MRVFLTGFMGSGKTTVGRELARELSLGFEDLDARIEAVSRRSIREIFAVDGERVFRQLERAQLRAVTELDNRVVALGGGALLHHMTMAWAKSRATVVFLDVEVTELVRRLLQSGHGRPLVAEALRADHPAGALKRRVTDLLGQRRAAYERANIIYQPQAGASPGEDARELARLLRSRTDQSVGPAPPD